MKDYFDRQISVVNDLVQMYRDGTIQLNSFIQRLEATGAVMENDNWNDSMFPIILLMEQVNAICIEEKRPLSPGENLLIDESLKKISHLTMHIAE